MTAGAFWNWAVAAYGRPGVADACLRLQDEHGQNTCLLLWAAWARTVDPALLQRAAALARAADEAAVSPLRGVRRALKAPIEGIDPAAQARLRDQVKTVELAAERLLIDALEILRCDTPDSVPLVEALKAASAAWGRPAPEAALADLATAID